MKPYTLCYMDTTLNATRINAYGTLDEAIVAMKEEVKRRFVHPRLQRYYENSTEYYVDLDGSQIYVDGGKVR